MRAKPTTQENSASGVIPPIQAFQPTDVKSDEVIGPFRLHVLFFDGLSGIVDMTDRVRSPQAEVFDALADPAVFAQAFVQYGTVTWPGDLDLAPDTMYDEIQANGQWILG